MVKMMMKMVLMRMLKIKLIYQFLGKLLKRKKLGQVSILFQRFYAALRPAALLKKDSGTDVFL